MKIAHLGSHGSFTHTNALASYGADNYYIPCASFEEVFNCVKEGIAERGVIAIENSLVGSIYEVYDLLHQHNLYIVGESYSRIEHCLLALPHVKNIREIEKVYSHPKALEQCRKFFKAHPWIESVAATDTASAAEFIACNGDKPYAAIGSASLADHLHLKVMEKSIQDEKDNYTRFISIAASQSDSEKINKASLLMTLSHTPGALHKILSQFTEMNLTKIISRPLSTRPFEYVFYLDLEREQMCRNSFLNLLESVQKCTNTLTLLGLYVAGSHGSVK